MKKNPGSRLKLNAETLRHLSARALQGVAGGYNTEVTCLYQCAGSYPCSVSDCGTNCVGTSTNMRCTH